MLQTFTGRKNIQIGLALGTFALAAVLSSLHNPTHVQANATPQAFPPVVTSPTGDPRLEPVPTGALQLGDFNVFGDGNVMTMRFPPRVNGQSFSAGDRHADLYVLFDAATGLPVPNAPFILEAIPKNGAGPNVPVDDLTARVFSSIWELHAVTIDTSGYDPSNPAIRIDSERKAFTSPRVKNVYQTNIFLNCPVVPSGSTMGGPNRMHSAFWNGNAVQLATFEIEDGGFNPQVLFRFEDPSGNVCGGATNPYLVASHAPGDPFYSTIWELWSVHVPNCNINFRSRNDFKNNGYRITSTNIRLNCPVTHVGDSIFPVEDAVSLLTDSSGRFNPQAFPKDSPATSLTKQRTFVITEVVPGGSGLPLAPVDTAAQATGFPAIKPDTTGNVIPLLLVDPFQASSSGPNSAGPRIRFNQTDLDAAYPSLPPAIENNFNLLINKGLLDPVWGANGGKSYQERLALIGRALFEMVFTPEQGANSKDVTSCYSCHSLPSAGGAARGLYTLTASNPQRPDLGFITQLNAGSMWGSGASELLNLQKHDRGERATPGAHGSRGNIASMRGVVGGGNNAHLGIQATEVLRVWRFGWGWCE
jgi:hypothetical protein